MKRTREEWQEVCKGITAGPIAGTAGRDGLYDSSQKLREKLLKLHLWGEGSHVLDIGCGNGRLAMALCEENITYTGLEIIKECVDYCNDAFSIYPPFTFHHIDVYNERYNGDGRIEPERVVYPVNDNSVDTAVMLSVMTHINEESVKRNLYEVNRCLKSGGKFLSTWFKSPPNAVDDDPARTVFPDYDISQWLQKYFTITYADGGETTGLHDQWFVVCVKE